MPPLLEQLRPAPVNGGFAQDDYWVWCGSVIRGDDGLYHMFASRWPRTGPFHPNWLTHSQVVRAVSQTPEGPYQFAEVVLPERAAGAWDGRMTHNPSIHRCGETFLLFYTGTTFSGPLPPAGAASEAQWREAQASQRIGLATAPSPAGPWTRADAPILLPRPGHWDGLITTNPAPCVLPDGRVLLLYKSVAFYGDVMRLGAAHAAHPTGPYRRLSDTPVFNFDAQEATVEDPFPWHDGTKFQAIVKDCGGQICGEEGGGFHAHSADGVTWHIPVRPKAYSRTIIWDDGTTTIQGALERPQLLMRGGVPSHLFAATGDGPGGFWQARRTWTMVVPLDA